MNKEAWGADGMGRMGLEIIGHRSSKSTFWANKEDAGEADDYDNEDDALIIIINSNYSNND